MCQIISCLFSNVPSACSFDTTVYVLPFILVTILRETDSTPALACAFDWDLQFVWPIL